QLPHSTGGANGIGDCQSRRFPAIYHKLRAKRPSRGVIERADHMLFRCHIAAALAGAFLSVSSLTPASAEVLRVMRGQAASALNVPMNRAVVVESDVPFAELSIANPGI